MSVEIFTDEWSRACCQRLQEHEGFRQAGARWESAVVLVMRADPTLGIDHERAVLLDLFRGKCREARPADERDRQRAGYVLVATAVDWRRILHGELEPVQAVISGRLRLEKGSIFSLMPHAAAARELVAAAGEVPAHFPDPGT